VNFLSSLDVYLDQFVGVTADQEVSVRSQRQAFGRVLHVGELTDFSCAVRQTDFTNALALEVGHKQALLRSTLLQ